MFQHRWFQIWKLGLASSVTLVWLLTLSDYTLAQSNLTPDTAPGRNLETRIQSIEPLVNQIRGGTRRGSTLFHSFSEFNIPENHIVYFENPSGITNILSRVTGNDRSEILGTLGVGSPGMVGAANLFLINPNGIFFGEHASLDTRGSFLASTANSLQFEDWQFSATNPQPVPQLSVNIPIGLQFGRTPGSVINKAGMIDEDLQLVGGLRVQSGNTLALVGGDVRLNGGVLVAPGGRVELGGVREPGMVGLDGDGNHFRLSFLSGVARANVSIADGSAVIIAGAEGGDMAINAHNLAINSSCLFAGETSCLVNQPNNSLGSITFNSTGAVTMTSSFEVSTSGGDINIQARSLSLTNSRLSTEVREGNAGDIMIQVTDFVSMRGPSSDIAANSFGMGRGGNISIETEELRIHDGAEVYTEASGSGDAGNLVIRATDLVEVTGSQSELSTRSTYEGTGDAGNLTIETRRLTVRDGGIITTTTQSDSQAGELRVTADSIQLIGVSSDDRSSLNSQGAGANRTGSAGRITITTRQLIIQDGAFVQVRTRGPGQGGFLEVRASDFIELVGAAGEGRPSSLTAESQGAGGAGDIRITTGRLSVRDGAEVTVRGEELGPAGNLTVNANSILLDRGSLTAETRVGSKANIRLRDLDVLLMSDRSLISAQAFNESDGGNITINAEFVVAVPSENNDITANAFEGSGGEVKITAQRILGLVSRSREELVTLLRTNDPAELDPHALSSNDITAISQVNPSLSGQVTIITPDIDPSRGVAELSSAPASPEPVQGCQAEGGASTAEFFNTGRGGLPPAPHEPLSSDTILDDVRLPTQEATPSVDEKSPESSIPPDQVVEAQGWGVNEQGQIILVATVPDKEFRTHCHLR